MSTELRKKEWTCYEKLNCGEGGRGAKVVIMTKYLCTASDAAEEAAEYFHDIEQNKQRAGISLFDGDVSYIEVVGDSKSFHEVVCELKRTYTDRIL